MVTQDTCSSQQQSACAWQARVFPATYICCLLHDTMPWCTECFLLTQVNKKSVLVCYCVSDVLERFQTTAGHVACRRSKGVHAFGKEFEKGFQTCLLQFTCLDRAMVLRDDCRQRFCREGRLRRTGLWQKGHMPEQETTAHLDLRTTQG